MRPFAIVSLILLSVSPLRAAGPSLEQIFSAPFPSDMVAAPSGGKVAWVVDVRGARNLWVAEPPEYKGRQLTHYDKDDGQSLDGLAWTPDAKTIVYVRGSGPNKQGENPNPTSDPAGAEQAVWRVATAGGEPVKVGLGSAAAVSPQGDGLALVRGGKVFWSRLANPPEGGSSEKADKAQRAELTPLFQARGVARALRWSPDGGRLAFISDRGDHAFVGVYDRAAKTVRWIAPSVDKDDAPAWSPDGTRIAFLRVPTSTEVKLFYSNLSGQPWSILVADAATGTARTVWKAHEGAGSVFHETEAAKQLFWCDGDRLVFPWEGDGWLHFYSVPAQGGEAKLLTPGDFEVEYATLTPDRRELVYNSNQDDIDRRHLWRVSVSGGAKPEALTRGQGIEWFPAVTSDGKAIAWFQSGARRPAEPVIRLTGAETRSLAPSTIPVGYPAAALVEPEPVIFTASDGMKIHAQLFRPPGIARGERRPALLFLHGGSHRQMLLGWHYNPYYFNAYAMNQYLASQGYLVLAVNYRSGIGYGLKFREALRQGAGGGSEFNDVLGAGLWLRDRPDVDPTRIGLWGGSYGGYLTAMGLSRASDLFAAGVDFHGVHDWNVGIRTFITSYEPLEHPDQARLAFESSPLSTVDTWRSPVLVIHGDDDRNVAFSQTVTLVEALRKRNVDVEQLIFPDEIHSFLAWSHWLEAYKATADFFERKMVHRGAQ